MKILVTGGTGNVGSQVVRELVSRGVQVQVLTRNPDKAKTLPNGVTAVIGNLAEPATARRVFNGFDRVFLINSVSQTETHEGLMAVSGMRLAGVKRVVYVSVQEADAAAWLPHFGAKLSVEQALRGSGMASTILRPNNFYQNDYYFKDAMLQAGIYPQPIGNVGILRVDVRDIAEAAAIALTTSGHEGESYNMVGPEPVTADSTAQTWSRALGKPIKYAGDDLDAWEQQSLQYMPDWLVFDFKLMYAYFQGGGFRGTSKDVDRMTRLLGRPPRDFETFAKETAAAWQGRL